MDVGVYKETFTSRLGAPSCAPTVLGFQMAHAASNFEL